MKRVKATPFPRFREDRSAPAMAAEPQPRASSWRVGNAPGALDGAGQVRPDGGAGRWAASCGGCRRVSTLNDAIPRNAFQRGPLRPRKLTREEARRKARAEGWSYAHPWGWLCPSCRFGFGVNPVQEVQEARGRPAPMAPRRRVVMNVYNVTDGNGRRLAGFGELLSCGHTFIPSDGTQSGNRTRRCLDCLAEGRGAVK